MIFALAVTLLSADLPVRDTLAGGETKTYSINVPAGSAARVAVVQEGIDVGVTLRLAGSELPEHGLDMVAGPSGEEVRFVAISDAPAVWNVLLKSPLPRAPRASFTISYSIAAADDAARAIAATRQLYQAASDLDWKGTTETTRKMYEDVAAQATANGDRELAAEATYQVARRHDVLGNVPGAIEWQLRALELFRELGRRDRESRALNRLGDYSRKTGEVRASEEYFALALPLARQSGDRQAEADILNNSGLLMLFTGRYEEALDQLQASLPLARDIGSANVEVAVLANIAECHQRMGADGEAVAGYERALARVRDSNLPARRVGRTLYQLAAAHFANGETLKAQRTMAEALPVLESAGDFAYLGEALAFQGRMALAAGDLATAEESFARALGLAEKANNFSAQSAALAAWAESETRRGDIDSALARIDQAITRARTSGAPNQVAWSLYLKALALERKNEIDAAVKAMEEAVAILDDLRGNIVRTDLRSSYLASVRRYYDLLVELHQRRGQTASAFAAAEHARARTFLESLAESRSKIRKGVDPALLRRERDLRAEINAKDALRARSDAKRAAALWGALATRWAAVRAVAALPRHDSPAYAALQKSEPVSIDDVRRHLLDDDTALVSYHLGEKRSLAFVVDRGNVTVHVLGSAERIGKAARDFHELIARDRSAMNAAQRRTHDAAVDGAAKAVADLVWKPVATRVRGQRALIAADGALHYVPFAALPLPGGEPLVTALEIVQLPSASVGVALRRARRRAASDWTAAVFADPVFSVADARLGGRAGAAEPQASLRGGPFTRLRFSREEAAAIRSTLGSGAFTALDFTASKSTLAQRNLKQYRLLHFATHGVVDAEHPDLSSLVLSLVDRDGKQVDGRLRLHEIYNLDLDADLVVLSACRTALGKEVHGEGLVGLTRGFMYAGTPRVVATMWDVDDRATAELMSRFYRSMLTGGLTPAAALRATQLSMLREPRWSNPRDWAAFALHGDWR